jgi:hypothetical protein
MVINIAELLLTLIIFERVSERLLFNPNHIGGVMVSVLSSSAIDRMLESRSGQTKDYTIGICCFSAKQ